MIIQPFRFSDRPLFFKAKTLRDCPAAPILHSAANFHPIQTQGSVTVVEKSLTGIRHQTHALILLAQPIADHSCMILPLKSATYDSGHIDSHEDIHKLANILPVLLEFSARLSLPLRLVPGEQSRYSSFGTATTDSLIDKFQDKGANRPNFERLLADCQENTVEFRCHPGMVDAELESLSAYTWQRERELAVVCAYNKEDFAEHGFELISFSGLRDLA